MRKLLNLLRGRRARLENDLDRELRYHFDRRGEDLRAEGRREDDARKQAAIEMGGIEQVQEDVRETWTLRWLDDAARDARYAARSLARSPGFTIRTRRVLRERARPVGFRIPRTRDRSPARRMRS